MGGEVAGAPARAERRRVWTCPVEQCAQGQALISGISHCSIVGQRRRSRAVRTMARATVTGTAPRLAPAPRAAGAAALTGTRRRMAGPSTSGTSRPRRELTTVLVAGAAGAGFVLLATRQHLARVVERPPRPLPATVTAISVQDLRPAIAALAVAALASLAAVLATRGFLRRLTGLLTAALGVAVALLGTGTVPPAAVLAAAARVGGSPAGSSAGSVTAGSGQGIAPGSVGGFARASAVRGLSLARADDHRRDAGDRGRGCDRRQGRTAACHVGPLRPAAAPGRWSGWPCRPWRRGRSLSGIRRPGGRPPRRRQHVGVTERGSRPDGLAAVMPASRAGYRLRAAKPVGVSQRPPAQGRGLTTEQPSIRSGAPGNPPEGAAEPRERAR